MPPVEKSAKKAPASGKKPTKFRKAVNFNLSGGIMRYSRHQQYKRKALWRQKATLKPKQEVPKRPLTIVKEIGGGHNGGQRVVTLRKNKANYPTKALVTSRPTKGVFKLHKRSTRKSLIPGRVVIIVAGKHKGKRVIVLKVLQSGLLLITGPFSLNSTPLRRISQRYVIATQTRINMANVVVPDHINDAYFKREPKSTKRNRGEGEIFAPKKEVYTVSEKRKSDQATVDKSIKTALSQHKDKKLLFNYLRSYFALSSSQYPHRLKF
ncbi:60S ribosomal protein L6 [Pseudolycoriella hygida]|uniref:Large ribosomal subunit protein eL6 n=1 Tax=Pseudolycoriella hygida TaxID=35572 RepID=A0A9Q0RS81_9DIPT|nr:60S ribosomal protein L6 [Pseudolycoriella hygida]